MPGIRVRNIEWCYQNSTTATGLKLLTLLKQIDDEGICLKVYDSANFIESTFNFKKLVAQAVVEITNFMNLNHFKRKVFM